MSAWIACLIIVGVMFLLLAYLRGAELISWGETVAFAVLTVTFSVAICGTAVIVTGGF